MHYVAIDTNIQGGDRYEVNAYRRDDGDYEVRPLGADLASTPTIMDPDTFGAVYDPIDTPPHIPAPAPAPVL